MFARKSKPRSRAMRIVLLDSAGAGLAAYPVGEYPLPEEAVLALSIEYFNDPEPCHIHRGAVHKRAMMELMEECPPGQTVAVDALSEPRRRYFSQEVCAVRMEESPDVR